MRNVRCLLMLTGFLFLAGCGSAKGPQIIYGTISVGNNNADSGEIRFVPVAGTGGSVNATVIVDGEYRIEGRGGVPVGSYRVEIVAKQKTGKQVQQYNGFELVMVEEQLPISPPIYAGANSPLTHEVSSTSVGKVDFDLPAK